MGRTTSNGLTSADRSTDFSRNLMAPQKAWNLETLLPCNFETAADHFPDDFLHIINNSVQKGLCEKTLIEAEFLNLDSVVNDTKKIRAGDQERQSLTLKDMLVGDFHENTSDNNLRGDNVTDGFITDLITHDHSYADFQYKSQDMCSDNFMFGKTEDCSNQSATCSNPKLGIDEQVLDSCTEFSKHYIGFKPLSPASSTSSLTADLASSSSYSLLSGDESDDMLMMTSSPLPFSDQAFTSTPSTLSQKLQQFKSSSPLPSSDRAFTSTPSSLSQKRKEFQTRTPQQRNSQEQHRFLNFKNSMNNKQPSKELAIDSSLKNCSMNSNELATDSNLTNYTMNSDGVLPVFSSSNFDWDRSDTVSETPYDISDTEVPITTFSNPASHAADLLQAVLHDHDYCSKGRFDCGSKKLAPLNPKVNTGMFKNVKRTYTKRNKINGVTEKILKAKYLKKELLKRDSSLKPVFTHKPTKLTGPAVTKPSSKPVGRQRKRVFNKISEEDINPQTEKKLKITGKFQDQYVYYLSKSSRTSSRGRQISSLNSDKNLASVPKPEDIVIPHLTDADLEAVRLKGRDALKQPARLHAMGASSPPVPFQSTSSFSDNYVEHLYDVDSHIVSTILSMESDSVSYPASLAPVISTSSLYLSQSPVITASSLNLNHPSVVSTSSLNLNQPSVTSTNLYLNQPSIFSTSSLHLNQSADIISTSSLTLNEPSVVSTSSLNLNHPSVVSTSSLNLNQPSVTTTSSLNLNQSTDVISTSSLNLNQPSILSTSSLHLNQSADIISTSSLHLNQSADIISTSSLNLNQSTDVISTSSLNLNQPSVTSTNLYLNQPSIFSTSSLHLNQSADIISTSSLNLNQPSVTSTDLYLNQPSIFSTSSLHLNQSADIISTSSLTLNEPSVISTSSLNLNHPSVVSTSSLNLNQPSIFSTSSLHLNQSADIISTSLNLKQSADISTPSVNLNQSADIISTSSLNPNQPALTESLRLMSGDPTITSEHVLNYLLTLVKDTGFTDSAYEAESGTAVFFPTSVSDSINMADQAGQTERMLYEDTNIEYVSSGEEFLHMMNSVEISSSDEILHHSVHNNASHCFQPPQSDNVADRTLLDDLSSMLESKEVLFPSGSLHGDSSSSVKKAFKPDLSSEGTNQATSCVDNKLRSIEKTIDYLCRKDDDFDHTHAESSLVTTPVPDDTPWIVTVTLYFNDVPAIMINNQPYIRLVDIYKQILPAKDTGILKKRCQLMNIPILSCTDMQRYFLVQYGKACNSKSTIIVSKDHAADLIAYYTTPQSRASRISHDQKIQPGSSVFHKTVRNSSDERGSKKTSSSQRLSVPKDPGKPPCMFENTFDISEVSSFSNGKQMKHKNSNCLDILKGPKKDNSSDSANASLFKSVVKTASSQTWNEHSVKPHRNTKMKQYSKGDVSRICSYIHQRKNRKIRHVHKVGKRHKTNGANREIDTKLPEIFLEADHRTSLGLPQSVRKTVKYKVKSKKCRHKKGSSHHQEDLSSATSAAPGKPLPSLPVKHQSILSENGAESQLPPQAANLYVDLFVRPESECVRCATCSQYLSVSHFMRHHHVPSDSGLLAAESTPRVLVPLNSMEMSKQEQRLWRKFQRLQKTICSSRGVDDGTDGEYNEYHNQNIFTLPKSSSLSSPSLLHLDQPLQYMDDKRKRKFSSQLSSSSYPVECDENPDSLAKRQKFLSTSTPSSSSSHKHSSEAVSDLVTRNNTHKPQLSEEPAGSKISSLRGGRVTEGSVLSPRTSARKRKSKQLFSIEDY